MKQMQTERSARFDALYTDNPDPWDYLTSDYERHKYDATLAALPRPVYRQGLEIGCSIGVLSRRLACRCEHMLAVDVSSVAIERASSAGELPRNLTFMRCDVSRHWPDGHYDLIVLSEILYFLEEDEIDLLTERMTRDLQVSGHCIILNWIGDQETTIAGQKATARLTEALSLHRSCATLTAHQTDKYTLTLLEIN
jgi:2-polyprenyl-3-methyl-5-hydroxy-6-metoxy-1,4-benzoquinol methylase